LAFNPFGLNVLLLTRLSFHVLMFRQFHPGQSKKQMQSLQHAAQGVLLHNFFSQSARNGSRPCSRSSRQ
jgi:hypothetical protein